MLIKFPYYKTCTRKYALSLSRNVCLSVCLHDCHVCGVVAYWLGVMENAGLENDGPTKINGVENARLENDWTKEQGWKLQDWNLADRRAGLENAGLENAGLAYTQTIYSFIIDHR